MAFTVPEKYRDLKASTPDFGNNGVFIIPHHRILHYEYRVLAADAMDWEHISVSVAQVKKNAKRNPTQEEMAYLKGLFWGQEDTVISFHHSAENTFESYPFVLHLWRPIDMKLPIPDVGLLK